MHADTLRFRLAALLGALSIALGSMGAHGKVHDALLAAGTLKNWDTAMSYHLPHAIFLALLALVLPAGGRLGRWGWNAVFIGMLLFCGSLYVHCLTQVKWLVYITPVGGTALILGWLLLVFSRWTRA